MPFVFIFFQTERKPINLLLFYTFQTFTYINAPPYSSPSYYQTRMRRGWEKDPWLFLIFLGVNQEFIKYFLKSDNKTQNFFFEKNRVSK